MKLSVLGFWQPTPSQPVPGPVHIMKLVSVFLSVISIGALRSVPLMTIFDVSAFANNSAGIASRRRMYKTESTRFFTARTHFCLKLDHPRLDRSIYGSAVVTRRYHNYALFVRPTAGSTSDIAVFHQLGSGVPVNPFAKSELLY